MISSLAPVPSATLPGPAALRAVAAAFAHVEDFDGFVAGLQRALERSGLFERTVIRLERTLANGESPFSPGGMTLPLAAQGQTLGTVQVSPGARRCFGAADLHLMAGLADFLSAALGVALRVEDAARARALLRLLLNQAPVGIAAYGPDRRPIVANDLAVRWLGISALPFEEIEAGATSFHLRAEGRLVRGEVRRTAELEGGAWLLVMHDFSPEQARLMDGLGRELYRGLAEGSPRAVVLLEPADGRAGLLGRLPALRVALAEGELAGPYDATRACLVLRATGLALRTRLRALRPLLGEGEVRTGHAEAGKDGRAPEALLDVALGRQADLDAWLRPRLLIHGENPAVAATLARVLGRGLNVVCSEDAAGTRAWLEREPVDGLVTELDGWREGADGVAVARWAREIQPGIQIFHTTVQAVATVRAEADVTLIEKPFDVAALVACVRGRLGV